MAQFGNPDMPHAVWMFEEDFQCLLNVLMFAYSMAEKGSLIEAASSEMADRFAEEFLAYQRCKEA